MEPERIKRTYRFLCARCGESWTWTYEIRPVTDGESEWRVFFRGGSPAGNPERGVRCPYCGGLRVSILPAAPRENSGSSLS